MKKEGKIVENNKPKVCAVSGAGGFVGTNLCRTLIDLGYKVAAFPREMFTDAAATVEWLKEVNPNLIFHLAAYGNHSTQRDYNQTMLANVVNTYTLLEASKDIPYDAFINVSTSSVYGKKATEMKETMLPEPSTFYGATKVASEYIARSYALDLSKPVVNVRPFSIYGPGEAEHRLIPTLMRSFILNEPMELADDPVHDWIFVGDFIQALLLIADKATNLKGTSVNVGTGRQVNNKYIWEVLKGLTQKEGRVRHSGDKRDYDLALWKADCYRLRAFGWSPNTSLEQGLWQTFLYYKDVYAPSELTKFIKETTEVI